MSHRLDPIKTIHHYLQLIVDAETGSKKQCISLELFSFLEGNLSWVKSKKIFAEAVVAKLNEFSRGCVFEKEIYRSFRHLIQDLELQGYQYK
jgi:hypothetical protein